MKVQLRPYQQEAIDRIQVHLERGIYRGIVHFATGLGKTITAFAAYDQLFAPTNKRCLFIAPSRALIFQTAQEAKNVLPYLTQKKTTPNGRCVVAGIGVVMGNINEPDARFVVGSSQTLINADDSLDEADDQFDDVQWTEYGGVKSSHRLVSRRMDEILHYGLPDVVMFDEAHHAVADKTLAMAHRLDRLRRHLKLSPLIIIGFTATPIRHDGRGLHNLFDAIYDRKDFRYGQQHGYLVPFAKPIAVRLQTDDGKSTSIYQASNLIEQVYQTWKDLCQDRYCVGFTGKVNSISGVEMSRQLTRYFQAQGVAAAHTDGQMCIMLDGSERPADARGEIYEAFRQGRVKVLWSYGVGLEGLDLPRADCLLWLRSTDNSVLRTQAVGRILRLFPNKHDALIVDFTNRAIELNPIGTLAGYRVDPLKDEYVEDEDEEESIELTERPLLNFEPTETLTTTKRVYEVTKILSKQTNDWYEADGVFTLSVSATTSLAILSPDFKIGAQVKDLLKDLERVVCEEPNPYMSALNAKRRDVYDKLQNASTDYLKKLETFLTWADVFYNHYTLWHIDVSQYRAKLAKQEIVLHNVDLQQLMYDVPTYIANCVQDATDMFVKKNSKWKKTTLITQKQQSLLRKLKVPFDPLKTTAGEASKMINYAIVAPVVKQIVDKSNTILKQILE